MPTSTTPAERNALLFLAAIGLLGGAVRVAGSRETAPTGHERLALARQMAAVDSAREGKAGQGSGRSAQRKGRRARARRDTSSREPSAMARAYRALGVGEAARRRGASTREAVPAAPVDVDVADARTLEALPGIGPALARRIVDEREARGAFGSLAGLQRVRGVGPKLSERLRPYVTFSGVPRLPDAGSRRAP